MEEVKRKRGIYDIIYCVLTGSLFLLAVNASILKATVIDAAPIRLFFTGLVFLLLFMAVFYNRITLIVSGAVVLVTALFIWLTWESRDEQLELARDMYLLMRGMILYKEEYGLVAINAVCGAVAFFTAIFLYVKFNAYALILGGSFTFVLSWRMDYRREDWAFVLFLFCICLLIIKQMNLQRKKESLSSLSALLTVPLCVLALSIAGAAPGISNHADNPMRVLMEKPLASLNDFFYLAFNPKYFSFQTTGFASMGDELGGSVTVNDREIMRVAAPNRIYLSGATKDSYTGRTWEDTLTENMPVSFYNQGRFEFLETAAALIRNTTFYESLNRREQSSLEQIRGIFPSEDRDYIYADDLPVFFSNKEIYTVNILYGNYGRSLNYGAGFAERVQALNVAEALREMFAFEDDRVSVTQIDDDGFLRSYLPVDTVTVNVISRTGSLFRPIKAWEPNILPETVTRETALLSNAAGDWRTDELLEENAAYSFNYLSPNQNLNFVKTVLNRARRGYYSEGEADAKLAAAVYDAYLNEEQAALHQGASPGDKAAVLFNALYETYLYSNSVNLPLDRLNGGTQAGIPAGRSLQNAMPEESFQQAVTGMNNPLATYADEVYARYLSLPDGLPERVRVLAEELTAGRETEYEKVKAIEEYLITFPYTLSPGDVPEGYDFVDYFLFEGREGYCTYYASAMAVLARCAGIPSRYSEGYVLPAERDDDGFFTVNNRHAHSWAEVYLEGYGWLMLEATAPYHSTMANPGVSAEIPEGMFPDIYMEDFDYMAYLEDMGYDSSPYAVPAPIETQTSTGGVFTEEFVRNLLIGLGLFPLALATAGFIFLAVQYLREAARRRAVSKMPVNEQAQAYFRGLIKMTNYYHYPTRKGETSQMYCARIGRRFAFKSDTLFPPDLLKLYYKARYGSKPLTDGELTILKDCYHEFVEFLRYIKYKPVFFFLRFIRRVTVL